MQAPKLPDDRHLRPEPKSVRMPRYSADRAIMTRTAAQLVPRGASAAR